ncbi:hypothetical protein EDC01DRAFT_667745 [Geopyxis carbonaria]|nr:hypothetical protein EDC01DRAFT_667745 [Geopyxis carbonaria]
MPHPVYLSQSRVLRANRANHTETTATQPSATKRSLAISDENDPSPAFLVSPSKRVKSAFPVSVDNFIKPTTAKTQALGNATSGAQRKKRAFGALLDITNTRGQPTPQRNSNASEKKPSVLKPQRTILKPSSVKKSSPSSVKRSSPLASSVTTAPASPRRRNARATSPRIGSGRGIKRSYSPPTFKRVDPPSCLSRSSSISSGSIDSLLSGLSSRTSFSLDGGVALPPTPPAPAVPDSWVFDIYEDSAEETLQNLMEHSTHTLDISDDESTPSELQAKGKENIAPSRLVAAAATLAIPQRKSAGAGPGGRFLREHREALREMQKEELFADPPSPGDISDCGGVKLPTLDDDSFICFATPKKQKPKYDVAERTPSAPGSPGWAVWESDHEAEDEKEGVPVMQELKQVEVPEIREELVGECKFEIFSDTGSIDGISDKEN